MERTRDMGPHLHAHAPYSAEAERSLRERGYHILFQYRDPRDVMVARKFKTQHSWEQVIDFMDFICRLEPWVWHADTVVTYERFILRDGDQKHELINLFGVERFNKIRTNIGQPTATFRAGRIGDWKTELPEEVLEEYRERCSQIRYWEEE